MSQTLIDINSTNELLNLLFFEFEKAEKAIRNYENLIETLPFYAVNELRFSASHVVRAVKLGISNNEECIRQFKSAITHAQRAYSNASMKYEVISLYMQVRTYRKSFEEYEHLAATIVPHYIEHMGKLSTLKEISHKTFEQDQDTPEFIEECRKHIHINRAFINDFLSAQKPLFSAIARDRKNFRLAWFLWSLGIIISFLLGYFIR